MNPGIRACASALLLQAALLAPATMACPADLRYLTPPDFEGASAFEVVLATPVS